MWNIYSMFSIPSMLHLELYGDLHDFQNCTDRGEKIASCIQIFEKVFSRFNELCELNHQPLFKTIGNRAYHFYHQEDLQEELELRRLCYRVLERVHEHSPGLCESIEGECV